MSDALIQLNGVSKIYRIFSKPSYKILDALSLPIPKGGWQEFCSLSDVNLSIEKGKKIGVVGRNGAGKSTLLKIIAGQIKPSKGAVTVQGKIQALMELGTGFHPDFSGWDNIIASLGYMGITGKAAQEEALKITEFSELEEFIYNPLKTYSAGMYARLSFTVATTIKPEILIIDEILGAGDAYFAQKAYDRMKSLTSNGATVLFVSHDMSAVQQLCDEAIWIERGSIIMRDNTDAVAKAYADMIRKRESLRLQARNSMMKITTLENIRKNNHKLLQFIFKFFGNQAQVSVGQINLIVDNHRFAFVDVGSAQDSACTEDAFILLDGNSSNWEAPSCDKNNIYHRTIKPDNDKSAIVVFNLDGISHTNKITVEIEYRGANIQFQFYDGSNYITFANLPSHEKWSKYCCDVPSHLVTTLLESLGYISNNSSFHKADPHEKTDHNSLPLTMMAHSVSTNEIFTGNVTIEDVVIHGKDELPCYQFNSFDSLYIRIKYYVLTDIYKPEFVVCIHRAGIIAVQALSRNQNNSPEYLPAGSRAEAVFYIPELTLGRGNYLISIGIFPELDRDCLDTEKNAFILHDRRYEIQISQPEGGHIDLGIARSKCSWEFSCQN